MTISAHPGEQYFLYACAVFLAFSAVSIITYLIYGAVLIRRDAESDEAVQ